MACDEGSLFDPNFMLSPRSKTNPFSVPAQRKNFAIFHIAPPLRHALYMRRRRPELPGLCHATRHVRGPSAFRPRTCAKTSALPRL